MIDNINNTQSLVD